jgi:NLI interacting factor-like phosphatase
MNTLPLIFLLDMDHSIIGESYLQVCRYEVQRAMKYKGDIKYLFDDFESGLLRPHFHSFIKLMKSRYSNAEFYIYTAAEKNWAAYMISSIERYTGIKLNRPIFSRSSCVFSNGRVLKSIDKILPVIFKKLKTKYNLNDINELKKQVILIDNNHVVTEVDFSRFVKCPAYEFVVASNVLTGIPESKLKSNLTSLIMTLAKYSLIQNMKYVSNDYYRILAHYYALLSECCKTCSSSTNQTKHDNDNFWLILERIFRNHNIKSFNKKVVSYINKNIA